MSYVINPNVNCTCTTRNINSKQLLSYIQGNIVSSCDDYITIRPSLYDHSYDFSQLLAYVELLMEDLLIKGRITHYNVKYPWTASEDGTIELEITFRQTHCLNVSYIHMDMSVITR